MLQIRKNKHPSSAMFSVRIPAYLLLRRGQFRGELVIPGCSYHLHRLFSKQLPRASSKVRRVRALIESCWRPSCRHKLSILCLSTHFTFATFPSDYNMFWVPGACLFCTAPIITPTRPSNSNHSFEYCKSFAKVCLAGPNFLYYWIL